MGNTRIVRAAAVQLAPVLFDRDGSTQKVLDAIAEAERRDAQLLVFPETFIPNYPYFANWQAPATIAEQHLRLFEQSVDIPGPVTQAVGAAAAAAGMVVVLGVNERDGGSLYNTQVVFDADGTLLVKRRKLIQLITNTTADKRMTSTPNSHPKLASVSPHRTHPDWPDLPNSACAAECTKESAVSASVDFSPTY